VKKITIVYWMIFKRMQDYFFTVWQITLTEYLKLTIIMPEETAGMVVIRARGIYHSMGLTGPGGLPTQAAYPPRWLQKSL
jgi:hypothetical protein